MKQRKAKKIPNEHAESGGKLVEVQQGDLRTIKRLQARCHAAGVRTMPGTAVPE